MNVLDLFSGIGGFSLGLERAGMRTVAFCERDEHCRAIIYKHWPSADIFPDIRHLTGRGLKAVGIEPDVICGGFPCQDTSLAQGNSRKGLAGERSGLWSEYARLIREIRPRYIIVENVAGLLSLGVGDVLRDLASSGYDAEWQVISAASIGAPHIRDRFWLVGYPHDESQPTSSLNDEAPGMSRIFANASSWRFEGELSERCEARGFGWCDWWATEPDVGRVANGISRRMDRLKALGNAVVPQIAEMIGRAILEAERT